MQEKEDNLIKRQDIIGLSVFSIEEGKSLGVVRDVALGQGTMPLFLVEGDWKKTGKFVKGGDVVKIGRDIIIVESSSKIKLFSEFSDPNELFSKKDDLRGKFLTNFDNEQKGKILDYYVHRDKVEVVALEVMNSGPEPHQLPMDKVAEITDDAVVITNLKKEPVPQGLNMELGQDDLDNERRLPTFSNSYRDLRKILEEHHDKFLLGKKVNQDLADNKGNIIIRKGETITKEVVEKAKKAHKYIVLSFITKHKRK